MPGTVGVQVNPITDHLEMTGTIVTTLVAKRTSESCNLKSCHHRPDRKGVHITVGDIS